MWFSWRNLKISIAGAKLSHLAQKDKVWDHGTMIETVKIIFNHVQKERAGTNSENLNKYMTIAGYNGFKKDIQRRRQTGRPWPIKYPAIKEISIIEVHPAKNNQPDHFTALLKEAEMLTVEETDDKKGKTVLSEQWSFIRQGDWWVLDEIRS